uniref:Uncharacterized protein n=1 Tax=Utricularia reniformis TaxID=192314 RepID=A0A1Y0B0V2_9LAMI|nr:hypothetical protein AEK19_MT0765 [Utricularia reniformis]ART31008.1 hypothetical protein AEK19_MT0765 [Utricularia reniformis]
MRSFALISRRKLIGQLGSTYSTLLGQRVERLEGSKRY